MFWFQKNNQKEIYKWGVGAGIIEVFYVLLVVLFMTFMSRIMNAKPDQEILAPIFMLLLFVFSAGISGFLVFGRPAYLFMQKQYKEALCTIATTFLTIFGAAIIVLVVMIII